MPADLAPRVYAALEPQCVSVGHKALETAMLEVRQPALHREVSDRDSVVSAGLNWLVDLGKETFVGKDAVLESWRSGGGTRPLGIAVLSGSTAVGEELLIGDAVVGSVRHLVDSPDGGPALGLASVEPEWQAASLEFGTAGGARLQTLAPPYRVPSSWSTPISL